MIGAGSVVTEVLKEENRTKADIGLIAAEGSGEPRQPTASPKRDAHPRWSPDGKWSALESARDGEGQIFLLPGGGGAARKVTAVAAIYPARMGGAGASYGGYIHELVSGANGQIQDVRHALRRVRFREHVWDDGRDLVRRVGPRDSVGESGL